MAVCVVGGWGGAAQRLYRALAPRGNVGCAWLGGHMAAECLMPHWEGMRGRLESARMLVFVEQELDLQLAEVLRARGDRPTEELLDWFERVGKPFYLRHVRPWKDRAAVVVPATRADAPGVVQAIAAGLALYEPFNFS